MKTSISRTFAVIAIVVTTTFGITACKDGSTPGHTHDSGAWSTVMDPDCVSPGSKELRCTGCNELLETQPIDALGHLYPDWTASTCTTAGNSSRICTRTDCGNEDTRSTGFAIDPDAHDYQWVATSPSFIEPYEETFTCSHDISHTNGNRTVGPLIITTTEDWITALSQLNGKSGEYTLTISGDIGVAGSAANSFGTTASGDSLNVTLKGNGKLYLTSPGTIFTVLVGQKLIIDSDALKLEGLTNGRNGATQDNSTYMIRVVNATLELRNGIISGNTRSSGPAGVYVSSYGIFRIVTGTVYGSNEPDPNLRNTGTNGAALYLYGFSKAEYGTFSGEDGEWVSSGSLSTTDETIRVVDGELIQ